MPPHGATARLTPGPPGCGHLFPRDGRRRILTLRERLGPPCSARTWRAPDPFSPRAGNSIFTAQGVPASHPPRRGWGTPFSRLATHRCVASFRACGHLPQRFRSRANLICVRRRVSARRFPVAQPLRRADTGKYPRISRRFKRRGGVPRHLGRGIRGVVDAAYQAYTIHHP